MSDWDGNGYTKGPGDGAPRKINIPAENITVRLGPGAPRRPAYMLPGEELVRDAWAWARRAGKDVWRGAESHFTATTWPGFLGWVFSGFGWLMWLAGCPLWTPWSLGRFFVGVACLGWALGLTGLIIHEVIVYRRMNYPRG